MGRGVMMLLVLAGLLLVAGCGEESPPSSQDRFIEQIEDSGQSAEEAQATAEQIEREVDAEMARKDRAPAKRKAPKPAPPPAKEPTPQELAYDTTRTICSGSTPESVAREFGASSSDPYAAAQAYAEEMYTEAFEASAEAGCIDGFMAGPE